MTAIVDQVLAEHGWWISPTPQNRVTHCACGHGLMSEVDESVRDAHRRHQMEAVERAVREQIATYLSVRALDYDEEADAALEIGELVTYDEAWHHAEAMRESAQIARGEA